MTHGPEKGLKYYSRNLSVAWAFTGTDRWRGSPNNHPRGSADTPNLNPRIHLNNDAGKFE
jgi:hypothetical protein